MELIRYPEGPWPRFGSCDFVLQPEVAERTSFTFSGSEQPDAAERLGTIDCLDAVFEPLLAELASGVGARVPRPPFVAPTLGVPNLTATGMLERLVHELPTPRRDPSTGFPERVLDTADVPDDFRGPAVAKLARRIAGEGLADVPAHPERRV